MLGEKKVCGVKKRREKIYIEKEGRRRRKSSCGMEGMNF